LFVRRDVRWDEVNAAKLKTLTRGVRQRKMAAMNGIEGAAENPCVHVQSVTVADEP